MKCIVIFEESYPCHIYSYPWSNCSYTCPFFVLFCPILSYFFGKFSRIFRIFPFFPKFSQVFPDFSYAVRWSFTHITESMYAKDNVYLSLKKIMYFLGFLYFRILF